MCSPMPHFASILLLVSVARRNTWDVLTETDADGQSHGADLYIESVGILVTLYPERVEAYHGEDDAIILDAWASYEEETGV